MKLWVLRWSPFLQFFQEYIDIENNWLLLLFCSWILNIEKVLTSLKKFSRNSICKKKKKNFFFLALPNIIPLLFYSNHTTNDIFIILYYNVGIFWQIAAVTYTIGPYWILDDLIIIYYLSSSQSILCVLPKLLSAAIIKMAWQNDCKKSSTILTFLPAIYQIWKTGPGSLMGSPLQFFSVFFFPLLLLLLLVSWLPQGL